MNEVGDKIAVYAGVELSSSRRQVDGEEKKRQALEEGGK